MNKKFEELTDKEREGAKADFLNYTPISQIARRLHIPRTTLQYHATKYWSQERDTRKIENYSKFMDTKKLNFVKMKTSSIVIIQKALADLAERNLAPTMSEALKATQVLEALDKITRLDEGNPTEITAEKPVSIQTIKDKIALDPFSNANQVIEEIPYTNEEIVERVEKSTKKHSKEDEND